MTLKEFINKHYFDCIYLSKSICQRYNLCNVCEDMAHATFERLLKSPRTKDEDKPVSEWRKFFVIQLHFEYLNYYNRQIKKQFEISTKLLPFVDTAVEGEEEGEKRIIPIVYNKWEDEVE